MSNFIKKLFTSKNSKNLDTHVQINQEKNVKTIVNIAIDPLLIDSNVILKEIDFRYDF